MSNQIPSSFVKQFSSNIYHLSQQQDSRLVPAVQRKESIEGEEKYFDRIGTVEAMEKVGRHSDTTFQDTPYSRRRLTMRDYFWADLVDKEDKLRIIHNPESEYAMAARKAMARKMDDIVIGAALGDVFTGKNGSTAVSLPNEQKLGAIDGGGFSQMNVELLRGLKQKFDENEVDDSMRHIVCGASEIRAMLQETEITNSDFNTVKALVNGEVNSFMGFNFHRIERLPFTTAPIAFDAATGNVGVGGDAIPAGSKRCFAFCGSGLVMGIGANPTARVTERPDKHYANQVYYSMSLGAMRMEEVKVIEFFTAQA
jgi:hypothetical protein